MKNDSLESNRRGILPLVMISIILILVVSTIIILIVTNKDESNNLSQLSKDKTLVQQLQKDTYGTTEYFTTANSLSTTQAGNTEYQGLKINVSHYQIIIDVVTKCSGADDTTAWILYNNMSVRAYAGISGNNASVWTGNNTLSNNTEYFVVLNKNGTSRTRCYTNPSLDAFPKNNTGFDILSSYDGQPGGGNATAYWLEIKQFTYRQTGIPEVSDTEYPLFTLLTNNNASLVGTGMVNLTTNINRTNGTAGIDFGGTNYSLYNISNYYYQNFTKTNNTYAYYYWSYGNGSSANYNKTTTYYYTINNSIVTGGNNITLKYFSQYPTTINNSDQQKIYVYANATNILNNTLNYTFGYKLSTAGSYTYTNGETINGISVWSIGDSITVGHPLYSVGNPANANQYQYWIDNYMGSNASSSNGAYNKGVSGETCSDMDTRFNADIGNDSVVIIMCGINDLNGVRNWTQTTPYIQSMVNKAFIKNNSVVLLEILPNINICTGIAEINNWIYTTYNNNPNVSIVHLNKPFSNTTTCGINSSLYYSDGIHFNSTGYQPMGKLIWEQGFHKQNISFKKTSFNPYGTNEVQYYDFFLNISDSTNASTSLSMTNLSTVTFTNASGSTYITTNNTLNTTGIVSTLQGLRINVSHYTIKLQEVVKSNVSTATQISIYNAKLENLFNASYVGNNATVNYYLLNNTVYYLLDNNGTSNYTRAYTNPTLQSFPVSSAGIDILSGYDGEVGGGNVTAYWLEIAQIKYQQGNSLSYTPVYSSTLAEGNSNNINIAIYSLDPITSFNGTLYYDSTTKTTTATLINSTYVSLNSTFTAPTVTNDTIYNFYWEYKINGLTYNTYTYNQTITNTPSVVFSGNCSTGTTPAIAFNFKDEENLSVMTADIDYNFIYGTNNASANTVYGNLSNVQDFYVCINATYSTEYNVSYGELQYRKSGYADKRFYLFVNSTMSNNTINYTLYLLPSSISNSFLLSVEEKSSTLPYTDKYVQLLRWYPSLNSYKITEMAKTDYLGETVISLKPETADYRIGIYESVGTLIYLASPARFVCLTTPCSYTLSIDTGGQSYTEIFDIQQSLTYNSTTKTFTYVYSDPSANTKNMTLRVNQVASGNYNLICEQNTTGSVGVMSCNVSGNTGDFQATAFRDSSPLTPIKTLYINTKKTLSSPIALFLSLLILLLMISIGMASGSPILTLLLGVIALIPATLFGAINWAIFGAIVGIAFILTHIIRRQRQ